MQNKWLRNIVFILLGVTTGIVILYFVMDVGDTSSIIKNYNNVQPKSQSGFSKSLNFIESYTLMTGDTTLAIQKGMSKEQVDTMLNKIADSNSLPNTSTNDYFNSNISEQVDMLLSDENSAKDYYKCALIETVINGKTYAWEKQTSGSDYNPWSNVIPDEQNIGNAGCFLYAYNTALGAFYDKAWMMENTLAQLGYEDIGFKNISGEWQWHSEYLERGKNLEPDDVITDLNGGLSVVNKYLANMNMTQGVQAELSVQGQYKDMTGKYSGDSRAKHLYFTYPGMVQKDNIYWYGDTSGDKDGNGKSDWDYLRSGEYVYIVRTLGENDADNHHTCNKGVQYDYYKVGSEGKPEEYKKSSKGCICDVINGSNGHWTTMVYAGEENNEKYVYFLNVNGSGVKINVTYLDDIVFNHIIRMRKIGGN